MKLTTSKLAFHALFAGPGIAVRVVRDIASLGAETESAAPHGDEFGRTLALKMKKLPSTIDVDLHHGSAANPVGRNRRVTVADPYWVQLGNDIDGEATDDRFGSSVAFSANGKRVVVGAPYNDGIGSDAGHVCIYDWNSSSTDWDQLGQDIDGEAAGDRSGYAVAISANGSRVVIGAPDNSGNGDNAGHVRIYDWNETDWVQAGQDIDGAAVNDISGLSVVISANGSRVVIGASFNDKGYIRIYDWNETQWDQVGDYIYGEAPGDRSGWSVAMSADGSRVVLGARLNDDNGGNAGHVRIYHWNETHWDQVGDNIDGEEAGDSSGRSVAMSEDGSRIVVGATGNDGSGGNAGHVRIYDWNTTDWVQAGKDIDGEAGVDQSGWSVAMSADGSRVVIGARGNDDSGDNAGHVRIYDWNETHWDQVGEDIDGEASGDQSGIAVAMSADGSRVVIGARFNGDKGHIRVYSVQVEEPSSSPSQAPSPQPSADVIYLPQWQIADVNFTDGGGGVAEANSLKFLHGQGDTTTPTRVKIYGLPGSENDTSTAITDACYSKGGDLLGTLDIDAIVGLKITEYQHNVTDEKTSFDFTFDTDIQTNLGLYYETELEDDSSQLATIRFCVMLELLNAIGGEFEVVNYAEFAFGYNATLNGSIVLANAYLVRPAEPDSGRIEDDTFAVKATVCGTDAYVAGGRLNPGDYVRICINSTSYPEASISGIDSLTYSAPFAYLEAIKDGVSVDLLTKFDAESDCDGIQCIVKTQLKAVFYSPDGLVNVSITGMAIMELGGRRVLAKVVPGDRSLQGKTSKSGFSIDVKTAAFDMSGTTKKGVVVSSILMIIVTTASLRFF